MLIFAPTPLGNLQDITYRTIDIFETATLFLCEDTRVTHHLLTLLYERGYLKSLPKVDFLSFNEHNGSIRLKEISSRLESEIVVYVSDAGMPAISDPGQVLVEWCQDNSVAYDVLPGASAVTVAYSASGFESGHFLFYGFLPRQGRERREELETILRNRYDTVLYESPHRLERLLESILERDSEREIFVAKELSKRHQHYYRGSVKDILLQLKNEDSSIKGEWVVVIKATLETTPSLYPETIKAMDLPPKVKAKLLARLLGGSVSSWYDSLTRRS